MQIDKKSGSGLTGLANCGNTCYLNTCLQILSHTYELNEILDKKTFRKFLKKTPDGVMLHEWDELRKLMWSEDCVVKPTRFLKIVHAVATHKKRDVFTGWDQNDMSEFHLFVLECFHEALSREVEMKVKGRIRTQTDKLAQKCYERMIQLYQNSYSELLDLFFGIQVWKVSVEKNGTMTPCGVDEMNPEPFMSLDLSVPEGKNETTLSACIKHNLQPDRIEGFVDKEGNQKERTLCFWSLPKVLMINIKRYDAFGRKVRIAVHPEKFISLNEYSVGYSKDNDYELFGIAIHSGGSIQGGHYYGIIKAKNGHFYRFNDTQVQHVGDENMSMNAFSSGSCFFYRKKNGPSIYSYAS